MPRTPLCLALSAALLALAACSDSGGDGGGRQGAAPARPEAASTGDVPPAPALPPPPAAAVTPAAAPVVAPTAETAASPSDPQAVAINSASLPASAPAGRTADPGLVRAQVLLARAHFSPGPIDGRDGRVFRSALAAFERAHGLPADGRLDAEAWSALTAADPAPAVTAYVITEADAAGPFARAIRPDDFRAMARLDRLAYASPREMLAERFHMDESLLAALNPKADFGRAGTRILVAAAMAPPLAAPVASVEVDKSLRQVRALDAQGRPLAVYPATVGSTERPAPSGETKVKGVARDPDYTYDPKRLTFGDRSLGKLTIKPGPNNPVGVAWIDLAVPTYGIHGTPEPRMVGKTASHGCVRLTNWDVSELAAAVRPGVKVSFVGRETAARR